MMGKNLKNFLFVFSLLVLGLFVISACAPSGTFAGQAVNTGDIAKCNTNAGCKAAYTACLKTDNCAVTKSSCLKDCTKTYGHTPEAKTCTVNCNTDYSQCSNSCWDTAISASSAPTPAPTELKQKVKCTSIGMYGYNTESYNTGSDSGNGHKFCQDNGYDTCSGMLVKDHTLKWDSIDKSCSGKVQVEEVNWLYEHCELPLSDQYWSWKKGCGLRVQENLTEPDYGDFQTKSYSVGSITCCKLE